MAELRPAEILLSEAQIQKRVAEMALEIRSDFPDDLHVIAVLKGAFIFLSDLARHIPGHVSLDFMAVSSYAKGTTSSGEVKMVKDLDTAARRPQRHHRRGHRRHRADAQLPAEDSAASATRSRCGPRAC